MRYAIITQGVVTNTVEADDSTAEANGWIRSDTAGIGDSYANGVFTPAAAPAPTVPQSLTPKQIRKVLTAHNLRAQVEAAVTAADQNTKDEWEFSQSYLRTDPLLETMAASLGLTPAQIDQLFIDGSKL